MSLKATLAGAALSLAALTAIPAHAAIYDFTFSDFGQTLASGEIVASNTLNSAGGYSVVDVTGEIFGDAITGLAQDSGVKYDDDLFGKQDPHLDSKGILVDTADLGEFRAYSKNGLDFAQAVGIGSAPGCLQLTEVSAAPEPAAWMTMMLGVFMIGALLRRTARGAEDALARA